MASFVTAGTPTTPTTATPAATGGATQQQSNREFITNFFEKEGKYGKFCKGTIVHPDGNEYEYYFSQARDLDKNGNKVFNLTCSKTPVPDQYRTKDASGNPIRRK